MRISEVLDLIRPYVLKHFVQSDDIIENISKDSRDVFINDKTLFLAIVGFSTDATIFLPEVLSKGCRNIVTDKDIVVYGANTIVVNNIRRVEAILANSLFGYPSKDLKVIGVTGTKGKTTISHMVYNAISNCGIKGSLIGTINYRITDMVMESINTTPGAIEINSLMADTKSLGGEFVSMEVSSHSLELDRVYGIKFDVGVFSNLSHEHLDFHKTMENYFRSKLKLFDLIREFNPEGTAVINIDEDYGAMANEYARSLGINVFTCSLEKKADLTVRDVSISVEGSSFDILYRGQSYHFDIKMVGLHNVVNAMLSFGAVMALRDILNISMDKVVEGISNTTVKGRFQVLKSNRGYYVVVDYAHTPDSLQKTLETARSFNPKRLTVVFGAGGDRDKSKRPLMGEVSAKLADRIIVTSDNPRTENPLKIISDILEGIVRVRKNGFKVIEDRRTAINEALKDSIPGEIVVIAGKGHEEYQIIGNEKIHFSDLEEVLKSKYF